MGASHPTLNYKYTSTLEPSQVIQQVGGIVKLNRDYTIIGRTPGSNEKASIELIYSTPGCGWLDKITVKASRAEGEEMTQINVVSRCTNVCCGWCGPIRPLCDCIQAYSDNGQNQLHIREVMAQVEAKDETFVGKKGWVIMSNAGVKTPLI